MRMKMFRANHYIMSITEVDVISDHPDRIMYMMKGRAFPMTEVKPNLSHSFHKTKDDAKRQILQHYRDGVQKALALVTEKRHQLALAERTLHVK